MARLIVPLQDMDRELTIECRDLSDNDYGLICNLINSAYYRGQLAELERAKAKARAAKTNE